MNKIIACIILIFGLYSFLYVDTVDPTSNIIRNPKRFREKDPPCIRVYEAIEKYSDSFNIPKRYAYGVAYTETGYRGPFHFRYNHKQTSSASAVGPMQIMLSTARGLNKDRVSRNKLMSDIEYNVMTSMKLLRRLKNMRGRWDLVFGEYNTGRTMVNGYSRKVMNYKYNWK
jgi:soluble lytic murein transglycosylase-like protein